MTPAASGGAGAARGEDDWLRAYGRIVAMLPRVEALAANALQHEADESRKRWQAAYIDLQSSSASRDGRKFAELQRSDSEDLSNYVHVFAEENAELQINLNEVDAGTQHSQNAADHDHITEDLKAELRKLKQGYEALCSEKDKKVSALVEENVLLRDDFSNMKKEATRATEARQELQQNVEQLQVASERKDDEIKRLRARAKAAEPKRKLVPGGKLQKVDCMPKEIDGEVEACKDQQPETSQKNKKYICEAQAHRKGCSEDPALRAETKKYSSMQMLTKVGQPETSQKCKCVVFLSDGYIGGDISGSGIIEQDDAEAEHFEPMVTYKDAGEILGNVYCFHGANPNIVEHETSIQREDSNNCPLATAESEPQQQTSPILSDTSEPNNSMEAWSRQDAECVTRTPVHVSQNMESYLQQVPVYGTQPLEFLEKTPNMSDELTAPNVMNRSTPSSNLGSSLVPGFHAKKKNSLKHHKNVKPSCPTYNEHSLGVEGRLNSLLDQDGGISSRKDSTNEFSRLLLMTAADGDSRGTSIRDLALILDALIQTKSGSVLLDIINMNGLQMLHTILKQNRDHFVRRPIIRKLLKVLEFLALRGILTAEKINEGLRCGGVESFRDSMLKLTRHSDKHLHSSARKFCDKWILPYMSGPASSGTDSYSSKRKRQRRWDHQPESHYKMAWESGNTHQQSQRCSYMGSSTDGDAPPGFEPRQRQQPAQASLESGRVAP